MPQFIRSRVCSAVSCSVMLPSSERLCWSESTMSSVCCWRESHDWSHAARCHRPCPAALQPFRILPQLLPWALELSAELLPLSWHWPRENWALSCVLGLSCCLWLPKCYHITLKNPSDKWNYWYQLKDDKESGFMGYGKELWGWDPDSGSPENLWLPQDPWKCPSCWGTLG